MAKEEAKDLNLTELMELRGVTQAELARMTSVPRCNINASLHGRQDISKKAATSIGRALEALPIIIDGVVRFRPSK